MSECFFLVLAHLACAGKSAIKWVVVVVGVVLFVVTGTRTDAERSHYLSDSETSVKVLVCLAC